MQKTATKTEKKVTVLNRYELKTNGRPNGYVVYVVRSSNGVDRYETTLLNGKATGCTCPSHVCCYHRSGCEAKEAARVSKEQERERYREFEFQCGSYSIPGLY